MGVRAKPADIGPECESFVVFIFINLKVLLIHRIPKPIVSEGRCKICIECIVRVYYYT